MKFLVLALSALAATRSVLALPAETDVDLEIRDDDIVDRGLEPMLKGCTPYATGYFTTSLTGSGKAFTINSKNQVAWVGDNKNRLQVRFQRCTNSESVLGDDPPYHIGVLYVPSKKKCIKITNQGSKKGPYYTTLSTCKEDYSQSWVVYQSDNFKTYWIGSSDVPENLKEQGGCLQYGYSVDSHGNPIKGQVQLVCGSNTKKAHPFTLAV